MDIEMRLTKCAELVDRINTKQAEIRDLRELALAHDNGEVALAVLHAEQEAKELLTAAEALIPEVEIEEAIKCIAESAVMLEVKKPLSYAKELVRRDFHRYGKPVMWLEYAYGYDGAFGRD